MINFALINSVEPEEVFLLETSTITEPFSPAPASGFFLALVRVR